MRKMFINTTKLFLGVILFVPFIMASIVALTLQWVDLRYFEPYLKDAQDHTVMARMVNPVMDKIDPFIEWLFIDTIT